jgi:hypothetical protein
MGVVVIDHKVHPNYWHCVQVSITLRPFITRSLPTLSDLTRERCQIIVITTTNNNFRLRYVSSKLDQVLLLLLLTNKL